MTRSPKTNFQLSIMSNWIAKHICTKVSFKITTRKVHVSIVIGWPWIWKQSFSLGIWNDDRTKIIVLPSFQLASQLNSQNTNETVSINELWHINLYMNIGTSNYHNCISDPTKMKFFTLFQFLTRLLTSKHLKLISSYLVGRNGTMWVTCFRLLKMRKKKISWNIKTKCVTDFLLTVRSSSMKDYSCHYVVST